MNEKTFGEKIRPWLERSAGKWAKCRPPAFASARLRALGRLREPVHVWDS